MTARRPWNSRPAIVIRAPRTPEPAHESTSARDDNDPRAPMHIGDEISAGVPGYTITLTRTERYYRVTVLDTHGRVADAAWCRNFPSNDETAARAFARAAVLSFRALNAPLTTTIRRAS